MQALNIQRSLCTETCSKTSQKWNSRYEVHTLPTSTSRDVSVYIPETRRVTLSMPLPQGERSMRRLQGLSWLFTDRKKSSFPRFSRSPYLNTITLTAFCYSAFEQSITDSPRILNVLIEVYLKLQVIHVTRRAYDLILSMTRTNVRSVIWSWTYLMSFRGHWYLMTHGLRMSLSRHAIVH